MDAESESNTAPTCFLESSVSFEILARISDLVGAAFFFAILNLLLGFSSAGTKCPKRRHKYRLIQLGAENNTEKSRCLAQMRKKICARCSRGAGFSGLGVHLACFVPHGFALVHCDFRHVGGDVQRSSTSRAPITIDTQSTEKSI